jgi:hypothetical protein
MSWTWAPLARSINGGKGLGQLRISDRLGQSDGRTPGQIGAGAGLGDTGPGAAGRGPGRLTDLRGAMSAFRLFMSALPPAPDVLVAVTDFRV